jgi:cobalt/nickel transport system permease protein
MHMADALISPAVGGTMWLASAALAARSARRLETQADDRLVPLMGVAGAFVFAAQMINFGIPGTGSSGHLGGGLLLAALLGPHAAFLVMASILTLQALLFADGGLLALGCNIFNLGALPCFVAYPLLFRPLAGRGDSSRRLLAASLVAALVSVELGAAGVVLQTTLSGRTELPLGTFLLLMLPIHLAIGTVEGLATASVLGFLRKARPEVLQAAETANGETGSGRPLGWGLLAASLLMGGMVSWFASSDPDGLEWSIQRTAGSAELPSAGPVHAGMALIQSRTALLPDYDFPAGGEMAESEMADVEPPQNWPHVNAGVSASGIVGSLLVLVMAGLVGYLSGGWRRVPRAEP